MQDYYTLKGKQLTLADRRNIEHWINNYPKKCLIINLPESLYKVANFNLKFGDN